jgi:hypothetical protein
MLNNALSASTVVKAVEKHDVGAHPRRAGRRPCPTNGLDAITG